MCSQRSLPRCGISTTALLISYTREDRVNAKQNRSNLGVIHVIMCRRRIFDHRLERLQDTLGLQPFLDCWMT